MARTKITNASSSRRGYRQAGAKRMSVANSEVSAGNTTPRTRGAEFYRTGRETVATGRNVIKQSGKTFKKKPRPGLRNSR